MKLENKKKIKRSLIWGLIMGLAMAFFGGEEKCAWAQKGNLPGEKIKWIEANSRWNRIEVFWEKNEYLSETENLILIRKKGVCPESIFDGEEIYRGNGAFFEDKKAEKGEKYCYGVGIVNLSGSPAEFKTSQLAEKLSLKESFFSTLASRMNLIIFLEGLVLLGVFCYGKMRKNKFKGDEKMSIY